MSASTDPAIKTATISAPNTRVKIYRADLQSGHICYGFTRGLGGQAGQLEGSPNQGVRQIITAIACTNDDPKTSTPILESVEVYLRK